MPQPLLLRKHRSLNHFPESPRGITRESPAAPYDRCRWFSSDSEVVQESIFKDRYFVNGIGSDNGSGIAKLFKDPAPDYKLPILLLTTNDLYYLMLFRWYIQIWLVRLCLHWTHLWIPFFLWKNLWKLYFPW